MTLFTLAETIQQTEDKIAEEELLLDNLQSYPLTDPFTDGDSITWHMEYTVDDGAYTYNYVKEGVATRTAGLYISNGTDSATPESDWPNDEKMNWDSLAIELACREINYITDVTQIN
jgi:hypothetical protein